MNFGYLKEVFASFAWKRITAVEADPAASNGHELNSSSRLRAILGETPRRYREGTGIPAKFIYLEDEDENVLRDDGHLSWYDSRENQPHRSPEWRLYYTDNDVIGEVGRAATGDTFLIAFSIEHENATVFIAKANSTAESQLLWLFGVSSDPSLVPNRFATAAISADQDLDSTRVRILEQAGIQVVAKDENLLARMRQLFGDKFPKSSVFSDFVRREVAAAPAADADAAIVNWMEREEFAFRVLERALVEAKIQQGFRSVDDFISLSLSVQNRRKARAGRAFENHLAEIFAAHQLSFARGPILENKDRPDFLFPSRDRYLDAAFPTELLTLLGAKTSCKDRWRQVLAEGKRMTERHLVTLEPAISSNQLSEMRSHHLHLVVPSSIHPTFPRDEQRHLKTVSEFVALVKAKQLTS